MKYRIIKESKNNSALYFIQVKFLFFWVNCVTKSCYRLGRMNRSSSYMLSHCVFTFKTKEEAEEHLAKYHKKRFKTKYKGNRIELRFSDDYKDVYINRSELHDMYASSRTYESSYDLEELKARIDNRIIKIKREVV